MVEKVASTAEPSVTSHRSASASPPACSISDCVVFAVRRHRSNSRTRRGCPPRRAQLQWRDPCPARASVTSATRAVIADPGARCSTTVRSREMLSRPGRNLHDAGVGLVRHESRDVRGCHEDATPARSSVRPAESTTAHTARRNTSGAAISRKCSPPATVPAEVGRRPRPAGISMRAAVASAVTVMSYREVPRTQRTVFARCRIPIRPC